MNYIIRKIKESEYPLLSSFLYEAIFIPDGMEAPPRSIIQLPELQLYISDFGSCKDDWCLVAEIEQKVVGAVWVRLMKDYGYVDDETPSFAISVYKEYRGLGIGSDLMRKMLDLLKEKGYQKASLSVQKVNYAAKMYQKIGFEIIEEKEDEYIMIYDLQKER